ncbi:MAG: biotin/lipoyl-containing protein, partial [Propionibacteriaceae bacterium]
MRRYTVSVNGQDHVVEIDDDMVSVNGKEVTASITAVDHQAAGPQNLSSAGTAVVPASDGAGPSDLKAPMPGVILEVHAKTGDQVQRGDLIAILEAMKMR